MESAMTRKATGGAAFTCWPRVVRRVLRCGWDHHHHLLWPACTAAWASRRASSRDVCATSTVQQQHHHHEQGGARAPARLERWLVRHRGCPQLRHGTRLLRCCARLNREASKGSTEPRAPQHARVNARRPNTAKDARSDCPPCAVAFAEHVRACGGVVCTAKASCTTFPLHRSRELC